MRSFKASAPSLLAALTLVGCATSAVDMAPPRADTPWVPATNAAGAIQPGPAARGGASYVLPPNPALAAIPPPPPIDPNRSYSLADLIDIAESNNPQTRIAWDEARKAALAAGIAESNYLPDITASVVGAYQDSSGHTSQLGFDVNGNSHAQGVISAISLRWLLFDFGERSATIEAAKQGSVISDIAFTQVHQQVIYNVSLAFYAYAAARARSASAAQSLANAQSVQAAAEARYKHGVGTVVDVAQAGQATAQANLAVVQARGEVQDMYLALLTAMGISPLAKMSIADLAPRRLSPALDTPVRNIVAEALARRPDILSAYAAQQASLANVRAAQAEFLPKIFLSATGAYNSGALDVTSIPAIGQQAGTGNLSGNHLNGTILAEPYYDRFERLIGASGRAGNINGVLQSGGSPFDAPRSRDYPNPPMKVPYAPGLFGEAAAGLGYHPYIQPSALCTQPYVNSEGLAMNACVYCGFCSNYGCEHFAKASPQVCVLPAALALPNFQLRTRAHVLRVELSADRKRAIGVTYVDAAGQELFQPANLIYLCSFAINNVRLMLLSRIGQPYDPRSGTGTIGRNFTHQTTASVNLFFDENTRLNPFMGAGAVAVTMDDFNADNFDHGPLGFVGGGYIQIQVTGGAPIGFHPTPKGTPAWGSVWKQAVARYYNHAMPIQITGACMPTRGGFVDLDPTYTDAWGEKLLRITFDFADNDIKQSQFLTQKASEIGKQMRGVQIVEPNPCTKPYSSTHYQTTHLTGGAAMGDNPAVSATNQYGQSWDVPNVFIAGSALFPQNSAYNPTGTIGALTYRALDAIKQDYLRAPGPLVPT